MKNNLRNTIEVVSNSFKDEGDGVISFPNGLVITDDQIQRNGTRYDIESLDISKYAGQLTADHEDKLRNILGRVEGVKKNGSTVTIDKIIYAVKANPLARLAYDLIKGGFSKGFSTETIGPSVDPSDNTHYGHELVGLSQVVTPNNYSAIINAVKNSLAKAKEDGLDTAELENQFLKTEENETMEETKKVEVVEVKNEITDEQVLELFERLDTLTEAVESLKSEDIEEEVAEEVADEIDTDEEIVEDIIEDEEPKLNEVDETQKETQTMGKEEVKNMIAEALRGAISETAKAPEFTETKKEVNSFKDLSHKEIFNKQVNAAIEAQLNGSFQARETLNQLNAHNLEALKEAGLVRNSMTLASLGNFVVSPEMLTEIQGKRTDYTALIDATNWTEIDTLEYAWVTRNGDIDMQNVALCDDGSDGNLKPISEYTTAVHKETMEQMGAVTVVCDNATRFFAANLLSDIAAGYRNDYDRKRAQLVIAKLQEAAKTNAKSLKFEATESIDIVNSLLDAVSVLQEQGGTLVFNYRTLSQIKKHALAAGANGPLAEIFTTGEVPAIFGVPYIVVPNDLMPTLDSEETVSITVNKKPVSITHSVFYADLSQFVGFTNEGLSYDLDSVASYEKGGKTYSAFQRGETILRGSFYRGGAFKDVTRATGILRKGLEQA